VVRNFVSLLGTQGGASQERLVTPGISTARGKDPMHSIHHLEDRPRSQNVADVLVYRRLRITTALAGQALLNSTEALTDSGTVSRSVLSNPSFGKYPSAVVVRR